MTDKIQPKTVEWFASLSLIRQITMLQLALIAIPMIVGTEFYTMLDEEELPGLYEQIRVQLHRLGVKP